jgi:hypothetical protein
MSAIARRYEPGCRTSGHFDCSARWRSLRADRAHRPLTPPSLGDENVSPHSSSDQRRAIRIDCSARWRSLRADRADRPLTSPSLGDENVSPHSSTDQRRAIRSRFSIGIGGTWSAGSKPKIRPKK